MRGTTLFLLFMWGISGSDALNLGKLFKRRSKSPTNANGEPDVEGKADEMLRLSTACDKELAKSMVILSEQKTSSEDALVVCREHRATARNDIDFLTLKVETATQKVADAEEICDNKMKGSEADFTAKIEEATATVQAKEVAMSDLKKQLADRFQAVASDHEMAVQETAAKHAKQVEDLKIENSEKLASAQATLENTLALNDKKVKGLEQKHAKQIEDLKKVNKDEKTAAKATLDSAQADHNQTVHDLNRKHGVLAKQVKTCDSSLTTSKRSLMSLESDHERELLKIAELETVTAFFLAKKEAKDFAVYIKNEIDACVGPIYDDNLKVHVEKMRQKIDEILPILSPVTKPLKKGAMKVWDLNEKFASSMFEKIKDFFVKEICPISRAQVKELKEKKILESPVFAESIDQACKEPTEFLIMAGKLMLCIAALILHRFIFRTLLALLLLPLKFLLVPFFLLRSAKKAQPATSSKARNGH